MAAALAAWRLPAGRRACRHDARRLPERAWILRQFGGDLRGGIARKDAAVSSAGFFTSQSTTNRRCHREPHAWNDGAVRRNVQHGWVTAAGNQLVDEATYHASPMYQNFWK